MTSLTSFSISLASDTQEREKIQVISLLDSIILNHSAKLTMPPRKRQAPDSNPPASSSRRRSTRISSSGQTSRYFEADSDDDNSSIEGEFSAKRPRKSYGKRGAKRAKIVSDDDDGDDYQEEEAEENGAQDDDEEEEFGEDEAPRVTIIPKPQLRDIDGVPYEDDRLHNNTLLFLKDLKANNNRSWLKREFEAISYLCH